MHFKFMPERDPELYEAIQLEMPEGPEAEGPPIDMPGLDLGAGPPSLPKPKGPPGGPPSPPPLDLGTPLLVKNFFI